MWLNCVTVCIIYSSLHEYVWHACVTVCDIWMCLAGLYYSLCHLFVTARICLACLCYSVCHIFVISLRVFGLIVLLQCHFIECLTGLYYCVYHMFVASLAMGVSMILLLTRRFPEEWNGIVIYSLVVNGLRSVCLVCLSTHTIPGPVFQTLPALCFLFVPLVTCLP